MTTLYKISEQIKLLHSGHYQTGQGSHLEEVKLLVAQVINTLFKTERVTAISGMGDFDPTGMLIATYDNQEVYEYKDRSAVALPVFPITLPMNMGIWYVCPSDDIDNFFVPMQSAQAGLTKTIKLLNNYENRVGYEPSGKELVFTSNLLNRDTPITRVMMKLLVSDVSDLGEYDPLPIPADMEAVVIQEVSKLLGIRKPTEKDNNPKDHD